MQQPQAEEEVGPAGRLAGSVRGLLETALAIGWTRLELLTVEAQLEIRRLVDVLILVVITIYAIGSALLMAGFAIVLAYWDSHRVMFGKYAGTVKDRRLLVGEPPSWSRSRFRSGSGTSRPASSR